MDLSLFTKIDEALLEMEGAFYGLVRAGLARDDEEELTHPAESVGAPVLARELGSAATQALQAIHELKQTSLQCDWKSMQAQKQQMRQRLDREMSKFTTKFNRLAQDLQSLIQATEHSLETSHRIGGAP